jgi:hypothetical protein
VVRFSIRGVTARRILVALAVLALISGAVVLMQKRTARKPHDLRVFFTCDLRGRLVPCGCFTGQLGGLTRIATMVGDGKEENLLKVDVGDALEGPADYERIEHRYILEALAALGFDAANLGHREAQLSAAQLRELKTAGRVPLLAANLLDAQTRAPIFDTHRILTRSGWRIALIGVMDERVPTENLGEGLALEKMSATLAKLLPSIRPKVDAVVLLAFADEAALHALAREFYELDVILGGKVSQPAQRLEQENRSTIFYTTNQSRALGVLDLQLTTQGRVTPRGGEVTLVHDGIPESAAIFDLAAKYREEIRHTKLELDDPSRLQADMIPGVKTAALYVGSESCANCHPSAAKTWHSSGHGHAFATLVKRQADADPNCLGCHTVGFGSPSGYRREFHADRLINVGCESCHGPGSVHVAQRQQGAVDGGKFRTLGSGDCQKCHHGEFSRPFDFDKFWPHVRHGREPGTGQ